MNIRPLGAVLLLGLASLVGTACAATPLGATDAGVTAARDKAPQGADVFARPRIHLPEVLQMARGGVDVGLTVASGGRRLSG